MQPSTAWIRLVKISSLAIYTGGIDPYLWIPIPGVRTLNFKPHRVDLKKVLRPSFFPFSHFY